MFTGIIEELGVVSGIEPLHEAVRLSIQGPEVATGAKLGDSIAVNGVCLTVVTNKRGVFTADVMLQTLANTALGGLKRGSKVNLERAVTPATRLGGHIVQGHVDGTGEIVSRTPSEHWELVTISLPAELDKYLVAKGSITVDGISLTVADLDDSAEDGPTFTVSLIPETLARTTLGFKQPGDSVNLEVDVIAKYVEKMVKAHD
ncbi:riboflavin synthase [Marmoricola sp. OAE513]|uniref:riboflavin synthase n=1 Tax=Marmoricola sp. OAE513 TaxID=2817894 RepID=UPI001AE91366